jgi:hypothetical protein
MNNKLFKPTRLMIKKHSVTGLRYFCKTPRKNYIKYLGSGVFWTSHIKKHGPEFVVTEWVSELFYAPEEIKEFAVLFSELFDIVNSKDWANLKIEDGLEGGMSSQTAKEMWSKPGVKERRSVIQKEAQNREDVKAKKRNNTKESWIDANRRATRIKKITEKRALQVMGVSPLKGKTLVDIHGVKAKDVSRKISNGLLNANIKRTEAQKENLRKTKEKVTCPHCGKVGGGGSMIQWHFNNCKDRTNNV